MQGSLGIVERRGVPRVCRTVQTRALLPEYAAKSDMSDTPARPVDTRSRLAVIEDLRELVRVLDQRVPHLERAGEARIASDAAALRREAVARIEEFERSGQ
jgi:hypothetical protein